MRGSLIILGVVFLSTAKAIELSDYTPYEYEVRFTNPECKEYTFTEPVPSFAGNLISAKPLNAFCSSQDVAASGNRPQSPQAKILSWIDDPSTKEIFFAALTFSNRAIEKALCTAVTERGVKVSFVMDSGSDLSVSDDLLQCQHSSGIRPERFLRGNEHGIGFSHIKLILINPGAPDKTRIAYGSGNVSSSLPIHHENWHFVTTSSQSYFAQQHLCMRDALVGAGHTKPEFKQSLSECVGRITAEKEASIDLFVAPAEGRTAMKALTTAIGKSTQIFLAAHRFSAADLIAALKAGLERTESPLKLNLLFDDDIFWAGKLHTNVGSSTPLEADRVKILTDLGAGAVYMETNQWQSQFQHNKFAIMENPATNFRGVFTGAGNFTNAAYTDNFENFYFVRIPAVVDAFKNQQIYLTETATAPADLPERNERPTGF